MGVGAAAVGTASVGRVAAAMTVLLWWSLASIAVSLVVGAFLALLERSEPETIDLDLISAQLAASEAAGTASQPGTAPADTA